MRAESQGGRTDSDSDRDSDETKREPRGERQGREMRGRGAVADELRPGVLLGVRTQLEEAAHEMDTTLRQAASSAAIGRHGATAAGFYAATGSLIIGGRDSHPFLLEAAAGALSFLAERQSKTGRTFAPDDLYWTNDPRCNAAGLEDLILACPVVRDGRAISFVAIAATHTALGRATLAPVQSLRREGVILPWSQLGHAGVIRAEMLDVLAANTESQTEFLSDLRAQLHALRLGQRVIEALVDQPGPEIIIRVAEVLGQGSRRALEAIVRKLESGSAEGRVSSFTVRITGEEDGMRVSVGVEEGAFHPPPTAALARAAVRAALREILSAEVPALGAVGGFSDAVRIETPWDASGADSPVGAARFAGAQEIREAVLAAIADGLPHLTHAPDGGPVLLDIRGERADGSRYRVRLVLSGGLGASVFGDGMTHASPSFHPQSLRSVETIERAVPLRVLRLELCPDSAGPGQYRGGLGASFALDLLEGRAEVDILLPGRPMGLRGGLRGAGARLVLVTPEEGMREQAGPAQVTLMLRAGHRLTLESPGGGGWGLPFQRSIMRIEEDLARGLITRDQSKKRYGVVLKPGSLEKDDHLTYRVRHYLLSTLAAEDIIAGEELLD
jgi:N-methylhydantoinase B